MARNHTYDDDYHDDDYREEGGAAPEEQEGPGRGAQQQETPPGPEMGPVRRFGHFLSEKLPEWAYNAFWGTVRLIGKTIRTIVFGEDTTMRSAAESFTRTMDAERFKAEQEAKREQDKEAASEMAQEAEKDAETARDAHKNREKGRDGGRDEPEREKDGPSAEKGKSTKESVRTVAASMGWQTKDAANPDILRLSGEGRDGKVREFAIRISGMEGMDGEQMKAHIREVSSLARVQRFVAGNGLVLAGADKDAFILERPGGASFALPRSMMDEDLKAAVGHFRSMEAADPSHKEPVPEGMYRPVSRGEMWRVPERDQGKAAEETPKEPEKEAEAGPSRGTQENARETAQDAPGTAQEAPGKAERDPLLKEAAELVVSREKASIGMIQRTMRIGFTRASGIMDELEKAGIVGPEREGVYGREVLASEGDIDRLLAESAAAPEPETQAESAPSGNAKEAPVKGVPLHIDMPVPEMRFVDGSDPYLKLAVAGYDVEEDPEAGLVRVSDREGTAYHFVPGDGRLQNADAMKHTFASLQSLGTIQEGMVGQVPEGFGKTLNQEMAGILTEYGVTIIANESGDDAYVFACDGQKTDLSRSWPVSQSSLALGDANELKKVLYEIRNQDAIREGGPLPDDLHAAVEASGIVAALREKAGLVENGEPAASATLELAGEGGRVEVLTKEDGFLVREGAMETELPSSKDGASFAVSLSAAAADCPARTDGPVSGRSLDGFRPEPSDYMGHMMAASMINADEIPEPEPVPEPEPLPEDFPFPDFAGEDWPPRDGGAGTQEEGMDAPGMNAYDEEDLDL